MKCSGRFQSKLFFTALIMLAACSLRLACCPRPAFGEDTVEEESASIPAPDENKVDVRVSELRARVSPQLEIVLPSGNIYEHFVTSFNTLQLTFNLSFSVIGNTLGGDITFAYPSAVLSPYVTFYQSLDFESYVAPKVEGSDVILVPTSKYITRKRGMDIGASLEIRDNLSVMPAFAVSDIYKGSLTESRVLEDGVDLTPQVALVYDAIYAEDTETEPIFSGVYARSGFSIRYRDDFHTPVQADNNELFLCYHDIRQSWFFEEKATLATPLRIWDRELANFYSLGGFESVRGYEEGSIDALRFLSVSLNVEREILESREIRLRMFRRLVRLHQYRVFFLADTLFTQQRLRTASPISLYSSAGAGIAFSLSGREKTHFQMRLSAAQAFTRSFGPIIYFRTSLFKFSRQL